MTEKKSFVLYFDMYPNIYDLPADQRGELLSAIFEYAEAEAAAEFDPEDDGQCNKEWVLSKHREMDSGTRMAFSFIAETIHRDTAKWWTKHERYQKAALERIRKAQEEYEKLPPI
ncbi:MAG: hypothetical protein J6E42_03680 [Firmicutes bacterium]|nr:hypothetical protein [Bacillota bacterium]